MIFWYVCVCIVARQMNGNQNSVNPIHAASYVMNSSGISMVQRIELDPSYHLEFSACATIAIIIYSTV